MADSVGQHGLVCPVFECNERFHNYHDEHATTGLIYHLSSKHPGIHRRLKGKLGGGET